MPPPEDLTDDAPTSINPYEVLELDKSASSADVKTAYRKLALKHHPDKATDKNAAHTAFQEIAFAYAILSDERRRKRYDTTGRTEESLLAEDDDFNWSDFYREQWADAISPDSVSKFRAEYQNSEEEKNDLLGAYVEYKGNMDAIFEVVMLSDPLEDEDRFRKIIDDAISTGKVKDFKAYSQENKTSKKQRKANAKREAAEAEELAAELGLFGGKKKGGKGSSNKDDGEAALAALIQQRQKSRAEGFLDRLEEKYGVAQKKGKRRSGKNMDEEPPEEAFEKNRAKRETNGAIKEPKSKRVRQG